MQADCDLLIRFLALTALETTKTVDSTLSRCRSSPDAGLNSGRIEIGIENEGGELSPSERTAGCWSIQAWGCLALRLVENVAEVTIVAALSKRTNEGWH